MVKKKTVHSRDLHIELFIKFEDPPTFIDSRLPISVFSPREKRRTSLSKNAKRVKENQYAKHWMDSFAGNTSSTHTVGPQPKSSSQSQSHYPCCQSMSPYITYILVHIVDTEETPSDC